MASPQQEHLIDQVHDLSSLKACINSLIRASSWTKKGLSRVLSPTHNSHYILNAMYSNKPLRLYKTTRAMAPFIDLTSQDCVKMFYPIMGDMSRQWLIKQITTRQLLRRNVLRLLYLGPYKNLDITNHYHVNPKYFADALMSKQRHQVKKALGMLSPYLNFTKHGIQCILNRIGNWNPTHDYKQHRNYHYMKASAGGSKTNLIIHIHNRSTLRNAVDALIYRHDYTKSELERLLGKKKPYINDTIRLSRMPTVTRMLLSLAPLLGLSRQECKDMTARVVHVSPYMTRSYKGITPLTYLIRRRILRYVQISALRHRQTLSLIAHSYGKKSSYISDLIMKKGPLNIKALVEYMSYLSKNDFILIEHGHNFPLKREIDVIRKYVRDRRTYLSFINAVVLYNDTSLNRLSRRLGHSKGWLRNDIQFKSRPIIRHNCSIMADSLGINPKFITKPLKQTRIPLNTRPLYVGKSLDTDVIRLKKSFWRAVKQVVYDNDYNVSRLSRKMYGKSNYIRTCVLHRKIKISYQVMLKVSDTLNDETQQIRNLKYEMRYYLHQQAKVKGNFK